ncbi:helix-turn-helix transcriptional regulator [Sphingopyxis sp.]|uniref:helix-turn-helix transcriptional regulator n=1 Tax=Sphingopyxis sp. TaxID=1908224 RepID=UPI003F72CF28
MPTIDAAHAFALDVSRVRDREGLADLLQEACARMGCSWFALSHHIDFLAAPDRGVRVHNYPEEWALWFDEQRLGVTDPVHRESQRSMSGFLWHNMKTERPEDDMILAEARRHGIGDGLTVPAHLPGHAHGSVSFAWKPGAVASADALQFARMIGGPAFDAARLIAYPDLAHIGPRLTRRQREVLIWSAKGESVRRIGLRLGLSPDTVREHLRNARQRYEANGGITLTVRALYDGDISFEDIAKR